jgi:hypothetical protein
MTSVLNVDTIAAKEQEACKLRCRYNQATASVESGGLNVSSISDDSTGLFTVSISSSMSDALYSTSGMGGEEGNVSDATWLSKQSGQADYSTSAVPVATWNYAGTSAVPVATWNYAGSFKDSERDSVIVFGDLA